MELKGKKIVIIGERDGVQGPAIAECVKSAGAEPVLEAPAGYEPAPAHARCGMAVFPLSPPPVRCQYATRHDLPDLAVPDPA